MTDPTDALIEEVAVLQARRAGREQRFAVAAAVVMAIGLALGVVAYAKSATADDLLVQNDAQVLAVLGLSLAVVGGVAFLRYSLAGFLRFWLARAIAAGTDDTEVGP
ncbi:MAG: hypothetical protein KF906_10400 [Actinobacteria bacterium]|nr:hypothetical protein [Actinomycetota bacterium]